MKTPRTVMVVAGLNGALATALSAVGAHALPATISTADRALFATASQFHLFHALAILALAVFAGRAASLGRVAVSTWLFQIGVLAFSGSLYVRVALGPGSLGVIHWITPLGGMTLIAAWLSLLALKTRD